MAEAARPRQQMARVLSELAAANSGRLTEAAFRKVLERLVGDVREADRLMATLPVQARLLHVPALLEHLFGPAVQGEADVDAAAAALDGHKQAGAGAAALAVPSAQAQADTPRRRPARLPPLPGGHALAREATAAVAAAATQSPTRAASPPLPGGHAQTQGAAAAVAADAPQSAALAASAASPSGHAQAQAAGGIATAAPAAPAAPAQAAAPAVPAQTPARAADPAAPAVQTQAEAGLDAAGAQAQDEAEEDEAEEEIDRKWTFQKWCGSLRFTETLAQRVEDTLCGEQTDKVQRNKLMLDFACKMNDEGSKETLQGLLQQCGALDVLVEAFQKGGKQLATAEGPTTPYEWNLKFQQEREHFEMSYGTLVDFYGGLDKFIGAPDPNLRQAMAREHDNDVEFLTKNYGITTKPSIEWRFAIGEAPPPTGTWPAETKNTEHPREHQSIDWVKEKWKTVNKVLKEKGEPPLEEEEAIGLRLYTGPMFQVYNDLLRALAHKKKRDQVKEQLDDMAKPEVHPLTERNEQKRREKEAELEKLEEGLKRHQKVLDCPNRYTTTIHVINSALVKLGKIQKAKKVYRGSNGALLPPEFWKPNALRVRGGVENGFLSTTANRQVAMTYAESDPDKAGIVFEIQMSMVDRGADLRWISQYPHEKELCFPPLTGLQVLSTRVERSVLVVETRLNVNLVSLTIEQVLAKRHKMVQELCSQLCDEVEDTVTTAVKESAAKASGKPSGEGEQGRVKWPAVRSKLFPADDRELWEASAKNLKKSMIEYMEQKVTNVPAKNLNNSDDFVEAVQEAVKIKDEFIKPSSRSLVHFLHATPSLDTDMEEFMKHASRNIRAWPTMPGLLRLDASGCEVTDADVQHLAEKCSELQDASFGECTGLTDVAVGYLAAHCKKLRHVDFQGCKELTDAAAEILGTNCTGLRKVCFRGCGLLTDRAVEELGRGCGGLTHVDFRGCTELTDVAAQHVAKTCKKARHVDFSGCSKLTDAAVRSLADGCKELRQVRLRWCSKVTCSGAQDLAATSAGLCHAVLGPFAWKWVAEDHALTQCRNLTDGILQCLASKCKAIVHVELQGCGQLTDEGVEHLASSCTGPLLHAGFNACRNLTDKAVKSITDRCPDLQHVDFGRCGSITDSAVKALARQCQKLQHAVFNRCTKLTDGAVVALAAGCKSLTRVEFEDCSELTDRSVGALAAGCTGLLCARFRGCGKLSDSAVEQLAKGCRGLQVVDLSECRLLTDAAVTHLATQCPGLEHADFGGCEKLTDGAVEQLAGGGEKLTDGAEERLAGGCKDLRHTSFQGCREVTDRGVAALAEGCTSLQFVCFQGCERLTDAAVVSLVEHCGELRHVDLGDCPGLTDEATRLLGTCQKLQDANFEGCEKLTKAALDALSTACSERRASSWMAA